MGVGNPGLCRECLETGRLLYEINTLAILIETQGYSWGSIPAINAPISPGPKYAITKTILISPAITLFGLATYFSSRTLRSGITETLAEGLSDRLWIVYGTSDQFTGVTAFEALGKEMEGLILREISGADHFYHSREHCRMLQDVLEEWVRV